MKSRRLPWTPQEGKTVRSRLSIHIVRHVDDYEARDIVGALPTPKPVHGSARLGHGGPGTWDALKDPAELARTVMLWISTPNLP